MEITSARTVRRALIGIIWMAAFSRAGFVQAQLAPRYDVHVVTADNATATIAIVEALRKRLPGATFEDLGTGRHEKDPNSIRIAVGPAALRGVLEQDHGGLVLSAFTSSFSYGQILNSLGEKRPKRVTAIYAEPSPSAQFDLVSLIYKKPVRVALLLGINNETHVPEIRQAAAASGLEVHLETVRPTDTLIPVLNKIADDPVLLAMPDSSLYNSDTLRTLLITTYRHNQAVIGFSSDLVKVGALATTFSTADDIAAQIDDMIQQYVTTAKIPEARFPQYFRVVVNEAVARSLNLVIDSKVRGFRHDAPIK